MKKRKISTMRIAMVLLLLAMVSMAFIPKASARFFTKATANDNARVAKFDVNITELPKLFTIDIVPSEGNKLTVLKITNNNEVAVAYDITLNNITNNIQGVSYSFLVTDDNGKEVEYNQSTYTENSQQPGASQNITLKINWPATDDNGEDSNLAYMGMVDYITVSVTVRQID